MRLSIIPLALHSLTVVTPSSSSPQHPKHIEEEPFLILDSGARVYKGNGYTPSNNRPLATGGVISVKLPSVGGSNSNDDNMPTVDVDDGSTVYCFNQLAMLIVHSSKLVKTFLKMAVAMKMVTTIRLKVKMPQ